MLQTARLMVHIALYYLNRLNDTCKLLDLRYIALDVLNRFKDICNLLGLKYMLSLIF